MSAVAKLKSEHLPSSTFENAVFGRQNCYFGAECVADGLEETFEVQIEGPEESACTKLKYNRLEANLQSQLDAAFAPGLTESDAASSASDAPFLIAFSFLCWAPIHGLSIPIRLPNTLQVLDKDLEETHWSRRRNSPWLKTSLTQHRGQLQRIGALFYAESLHPGHHSIAQEVVQYPLTFSFDGNVERVAGIAFHTEWLHPGHHSIAQDPVQYPLTFSFSGNVEQVGGIASQAKSLHPGHHSITQDPVQSPLMFSFDGNVECVGSIVATIALARVEYIAPSQLVGIMTPGASAVVW
ncbi:hypothetical protein C8F04DRAFT_1195304 [Mycena alexandri]|uniref:Uncharacterized protein n=1 Tax=Mycena alexandri TaxID=1745969 RepID=A0AAD6S5E1_9AGAR|nr:hypothetical protein C8F04DRAFT_1195304 [Mycena alexandri]